MGYLQLLNKDLILFLLQQRWARFKKNFWKNGGFRNPKHLIWILLLVCAVYTFFRERGWLPKKSIRGKHIYLTGAGSGLGRGMALKFATLGANLTLSDINEAGLLETKKMILALTGRDTNVLAIKLDVSDREAIRESAVSCRQKFGDVDILINNAGIVQGK